MPHEKGRKELTPSPLRPYKNETVEYRWKRHRESKFSMLAISTPTFFGIVYTSFPEVLVCPLAHSFGSTMCSIFDDIKRSLFLSFGRVHFVLLLSLLGIRG